MSNRPAFPTRDAAIGVIQRELTAFARRARARAAELHPGLSLVESSILDLVIARDGCLGSDLAEHFMLDRSTVSRQVAALERHGYLTREVDPGNRRNHILRASARGRRIAREAENRRSLAFGERLRDWDEDDIARFAGYLMRYNEADGA